MTDEPNQGATGAAPAEDTPPAPYAPPLAPAFGESPLAGDSQGDVFGERPELFVAGAFVGGLVLAQVLRRIGS